MAPPWSPCALVTTEPKPTTRPGHLEGQGMGAAQTTFILLVLPIARQAGSGQLHVSHVGRVWTSLTGRAAAPTSPTPPSMPSPPPHWHTRAGDHAGPRRVTVMLRDTPAPSRPPSFPLLTGDQMRCWAHGPGEGRHGLPGRSPHPTLRLHQNPNPTSLWGCEPGFPHGDPPPESGWVEAEDGQSPSYPWQAARSGKPHFQPRPRGPIPAGRQACCQHRLYSQAPKWAPAPIP